MRTGCMGVTFLVASSLLAQAPALVELHDARFNVSALGPTGWTFAATSTSHAALHGATGTIDISVAVSSPSPATSLGPNLGKAVGPWTCTETAVAGTCVKGTDGGVISVSLTTSASTAYRQLGGLELVRRIGDSARGFRAAPSKSVAPAATGFPACDAYFATVRRYLQCSMVPAAAKAAAQQGLDQAAAALAQISSTSPDVQKQVQAQCTQSENALKQSASAMGCAL
jgi:hypothetical protein